MLALVVEDDNSLRIIYRRVLEDTGFEVLEAEDGRVALAILAQHVPDLIFLDMLLPHVNGVTILNHITTSNTFQHTRTIIVSSNSQFEKMVHPDQLVSFVLKPIRPAQIRDIARHVVQHT